MLAVVIPVVSSVVSYVVGRVVVPPGLPGVVVLLQCFVDRGKRANENGYER